MFRPAPKPPRPERGSAACVRHMELVAQLPCSVCGIPGPSIVHHCITGRFSQRRASDFDTIPLCWRHHDAQSPDGIHYAPAAWKRLHGADHGYIAGTVARIAKLMRETV